MSSAIDKTEHLVDRPPLRELVVERIQDMIIDGRLQPGERLIETKMAEELGLSRGPIREALQTLKRDGWVDQIPRRGTYVHQPTGAELDSFFSMRRLLDGFAAALAADSPPDEERLAELEAIIDETAQGLDSGDPRRIADLNEHFHLAVTSLAGNEVLVAVVNWMNGRNRWFTSPLAYAIADRDTGNSLEGGLQLGERARHGHHRIFDAIRARDSAAARKAAEEHVDEAWTTYRNLYALSVASNLSET